MKTRAKTAGFTLVELMIVVAIIAVLAIVAVPNFINYRDKSRVSQVVGTCGAIRAALASFAASHANNAYPATGVITDFPSLSAFVNAHGGFLPATGIFAMSHYDVFDSDGDTAEDTYSMRLVVNGVPSTIAGATILITPQGIFKCLPGGSPC